MKRFARQIPNILSAWRLLTFPVLLWFIFHEQRDYFVLLLSINLITDIADGLIARLFKLQTEFGAKLDSLADIGTYIAAFTGFAYLDPGFIASKKIAVSFLLLFWIASYIVCLFRFRQAPHLHLYSTKIAGYLQGIFIFTYFNWGNAEWYFYLMCGFSLAAFAEELIVISMIPQLRSNAKGIWWMMKQHGRIQ